jgi:hypothetical protein
MLTYRLFADPRLRAWLRMLAYITQQLNQRGSFEVEPAKFQLALNLPDDFELILLEARDLRPPIFNMRHTPSHATSSDVMLRFWRWHLATLTTV